MDLRLGKTADFFEAEMEGREVEMKRNAMTPFAFPSRKWGLLLLAGSRTQIKGVARQRRRKKTGWKKEIPKI